MLYWYLTVHPGGWFNIKMQLYQQRKFYGVDKIILQPSCFKNIYTTRASIQKHGQQMSGPDRPNCESIRHESEGWVVESPSGWNIFCL